FSLYCGFYVFFFFQAEDGIRDRNVTGVQTCALPICFLMTEPTRVPLVLVGGGWTADAHPLNYPCNSIAWPPAFPKLCRVPQPVARSSAPLRGSVEVRVESEEGEDVLPSAHHGPIEFGFGVESLRPGFERTVESVRHRQRRLAPRRRLRIVRPAAGDPRAGIDVAVGCHGQQIRPGPGHDVDDRVAASPDGQPFPVRVIGGEPTDPL